MVEDSPKRSLFRLNGVFTALPEDGPATALPSRSVRVQPTHDPLKNLEGPVSDSHQRALSQYIRESYPASLGFDHIDPRQTTFGQLISGWSPDERQALARSIVVRIALRSNSNELQPLKALLTTLTRRRRAWDETILVDMVKALSTYSGSYLWALPTATVVGLVERHLQTRPLSDQLREGLCELGRLYKVRATSLDERSLYRRIQRLSSLNESNEECISFYTGEAWTEALAESIRNLSLPQRQACHKLIRHAERAKSSTPTPTWLKTAVTLLQPIGTSVFGQLASNCLYAIGEKRNLDRSSDPFTAPLDLTRIHERHSDLLRGIVICAGLVGVDDLIDPLGSAAARCFERIPGQQPRSLKIAGACIQALSMCGSKGAYQKLIELRTQARQKSIQAKLDEAIRLIKLKVAIQPEQVNESSVPEFQMSDVGVYQQPVGGFTASLTIHSPGFVDTSWQRASDRPTFAAPKTVRTLHKAELDSVRRRCREIRAAIPDQRLRLERLFVSRAHWSYPQFCNCCLNQPLIGPLVRCLIWRFHIGDHVVDAIWRDGQWRDAQDRPVRELSSNSTRVLPWHPLTASPNSTQRWQRYVEQHGICQPFKQAHREVYYRSDEVAEQPSGSRRFSNQCAELWRLEHVAAQRGWRLSDTTCPESTLQAYWDLAEWEIQVAWRWKPAPLWLSQPGCPRHHSQEIQFWHDGQPLLLADVPDVVYSETMREIECYFLQYAGIGQFAAQYFQSTDRKFRSHWLSVAFGNRTESRRVRQDILARLVPRSRLADRLRLDQGILHVAGDGRSYEIDLASGQVRTGPLGEVIHPYGYAYSAGHLGLAPGNDFPRLPFGGDVRLACIVRQAQRLARGPL